jgi:hypothetical protein
MAKKIVTTESTAPRIRTTSPTQPSIDPAVVARALGAEPTGVKREGGGPIALSLLRAARAEAPRPDGTPSAPGGTSPAENVPVSDADWQELERLAASLAEEGFTPSAGQVASVLLRMSLETLAKDEPQLLKQRLHQEAPETR